MPLPQKRTMPKWLREISPVDIKPHSLPLKKLLQSSLFYPASGMDGDPVKYFAGSLYSFVYVDNSITFEQLNDELDSRGFTGYNLLGFTQLDESPLSLSSWNSQYFDATNKLTSGQDPYGAWCIFERNSSHGPDYGPERFSLLFIHHEGVLTYENLYLKYNISPRVVAIIQPGYGCGGNWTDFNERHGILAHLMLDESDKKPGYLLYGGDFDCSEYQNSCWPEYDEQLRFFAETHCGGCLTLWQPHSQNY